MKNIETLTNLLKNKYGAEPMDPEKAANWTEADETLIIGYSFPDEINGRLLLTKKEVQMLTDDQRAIYMIEKKNPFKNVMAIVYRNKNGEINLRVTNGFAGRVYTEFACWKDMPEETQTE